MKLVTDNTKRRKAKPRTATALQPVTADSSLPAPIVVLDTWAAVKKIGRPSKLTPELIEGISDHIAENGCYIQDACALFGVSRSVFYDWKKRGEQDRDAGRETLHSAFLDTIEKADAFIRTKIARESYTGGNKWVPMMTLGERKYPEMYGRRAEASEVPRVIVQIGVRDGDVQVTPMVAAGDRPRQLSE